MFNSIKPTFFLTTTMGLFIGAIRGLNERNDAACRAFLNAHKEKEWTDPEFDYAYLTLTCPLAILLSKTITYGVTGASLGVGIHIISKLAMAMLNANRARG